MTRCLTVAILVFVVAEVAEAQQVWMSVGGGYLSQSSTLDDRVSLTEYFEPSVLEAQYPGGGGALLDAAVHVGVTRAWAATGGVAFFRRTSSAALTGLIPHPLYFGQPRAVEGITADASRRELTLRAEMAWTTPLFSRARLTLSGGPMAVNASQAMVTSVASREQAYPFDTVDLTPSTEPASDWGIGATGAINVSWAATSRLAVGVTGRWSHASISLRSRAASAGGPSIISAIAFQVR
jgi:hypothetical protein